MVDIQTVSIMLASASVIAGVVYYAFQVRHQTKIRQADLAISARARNEAEALHKRIDRKTVSILFSSLNPCTTCIIEFERSHKPSE